MITEQDLMDRIHQHIDDLTIACWFIDKAEKYQECESYIYVKDLFSSETNS
jgi:hypothetical protein